MDKSLKRLAIEILTRRIKNSGGLVTKSGGGIVWRMDTIDSEKDVVVVSTEMGVWRENHLLRLLRLRLFQESRYLIGMLSQKSLNDIGGCARWHGDTNTLTGINPQRDPRTTGVLKDLNPAKRRDFKFVEHRP